MGRFRVVCLWLTAALLAAQQPRSLSRTYAPDANKLVAAALADDGGYEKLEHLTTRIGHRLSGSASLDQALQWVADGMRADGLDNVTLQPVMVPHWVRGRESARIVAPAERPIAVLGLGGTIATPGGGVRGEVVVAHTFDELDKLGRARVEGRIVLLSPAWAGANERDRYAATSPYRSRGPSRAAALGAKAVLVRSLTGHSLYTPHTGGMNYDAAQPRIPAAAVTVEDAAWMERQLAAGGPVEVELILEGHHLEPDAPSANVMGELRGRELPEEVVAIGGHIDSWDVGQGAHDDGAGVVAAWQAVALMKKLGLQPRRTIRVVGWTNEENGARGARAYRDALGANLKNHVAAIEMDMGAEAPVGWDLAIGQLLPSDPAYLRAQRTMINIASLLKPIGATGVFSANDETDIDPMIRGGVPGLGLRTVREHYFDWHHSHADTFDKIDRGDLRKCIAALAVASFVLADMPGRLGE